MNKRILPIIVSPDISIREAMIKINDAPHCDPPAPNGILLVVDENNVLVGSLTDGDIRRAIISDLDIKTRIKEIVNKNPIVAQSNLPPHEMIDFVYSQIRDRNKPDQKLDKLILIDRHQSPQDVLSFYEIWRQAEIKTRTVCIVGLGFIGLSLALTFAESGFTVIGVDTNKDIIDSLKTGMAHFHEKGIKRLLRKHLNKSLIIKDHFYKDQSDVYIACVGTPVDDTNNVNLDYLRDSINEIGSVLKKNDLVILRSTVPIGTCRDLVIPLLERVTGLEVGVDFLLSFAPERTVEGNALEEIRSLPQIIGGYDRASTEMTKILFGHFVASTIIVSSIEAAESIKLLNNTYRDWIFSFSNEMSQLLDKFNINVYEVIRAANQGYPRDPIPLPSPGVGGYCLSKDPFILLNSARKVDFTPTIPISSREINESMIVFAAKKIKSFIRKYKSEDDGNIKIFAMGLAFKGEPETSDIRHSPALAIIEELKKDFSNIYVYDPVVEDSVIRTECQLTPTSIEEGFHGADCVLILNNHRSFKEIALHSLANITKKPVLLFDSWGLFIDDDFTSLEHLHYDGLSVGNKRISTDTQTPKYGIVNFSYGTGPFIIMARMAINFNNELEKREGKRLGFVIPWVYGTKQKEIMLEEFGNHYKKHPGELLLSKELGEILKSVFHCGEKYQDALDRWNKNAVSASKRAQKILSGNIEVETLEGVKKTIDAKRIVVEINRSPKVRYGIYPSYCVTFGHTEEILQKTLESDNRISGEILRTGIETARFVEAGHTMYCVSYPATFTYKKHQPRYFNEKLVPPVTNINIDRDIKDVETGIYVTVSGIPGMEKMYLDASRFGLKIYTNDPSKVVNGVKAPPQIISNKNILFHFARAGWGSVWVSLLTETPIVLPEYNDNDDPEIYFNNIAVNEMSIGTIYRGQDVKEIMELCPAAKANCVKIKNEILNTYGTLDGNEISSLHFVKDFISRKLI